MKKSVQYYKVIDTKHGHHGFFYKLGINSDPNPRPLSSIHSCSPGALYFTTLKNLSRWAECGDSIAWITPISPIKKDEDSSSEKWKAHTVKVTKILPIKQAVPLLKGLTANDYDSFDMGLTEKMVMESDWTPGEKLDWLMDNDKSPVKLLLENHSNSKFLLNVSHLDYDWSVSESKTLVKAGLHKVIGYEGVSNLVRNDEYKTLKLLVEADYRKFIQLISEF